MSSIDSVDGKTSRKCTARRAPASCSRHDPTQPMQINSAAGPFGLYWTPVTLNIAAKENAAAQFADPVRLLSKHPSHPLIPLTFPDGPLSPGSESRLHLEDRDRQPSCWCLSSTAKATTSHVHYLFPCFLLPAVYSPLFTYPFSSSSATPTLVWSCLAQTTLTGDGQSPELHRLKIASVATPSFKRRPEICCNLLLIRPMLPACRSRAFPTSLDGPITPCRLGCEAAQPCRLLPETPLLRLRHHARLLVENIYPQTTILSCGRG